MNAAQRASRQVLLIALTLVGLGIVMVYSSSSVLAGDRYADSGFFLQRQFVRALAGVSIMLILAHVPVRLWARWARLLLLLGVAALVLVLIFGGGRSTQRWLLLPLPMAGLSFQPSELAKLVLILYLGDILVRKEGQMQDFEAGLLPRLLLVGLIVGLILLQPDLGTALAIGLISFVMLWLGGARLLHLAGAGLATLPLVALSLYILPYQFQRLRSFLQAVDPRGAGYQVQQALLSLGSGGLFGVGLGNSMQKQYFLPEAHTDFVFAFVGEELGLAGTLSIIALFVALALCGVRIAREAPTFHGFLVASGITLMISVYAMLNIGVATAVLPTTGLPLPFISYGGSSLLWNLSGIGILAAIGRQSAPPDRTGMARAR